MIIIFLILIIILYLFFNKKNKIIKKYIYSTDEFIITKILENNWKIIRDEYMKLPKDKMISNIGRKQKNWFNDSEFENLLKIHQNKSGWIYGWNTDNNKNNKNWINWGLIYNGKPIGKNSKLCPKTTKLLLSIPKIKVAGFSLMKPNSIIKEHYDRTGIIHNSLAYHLGLDVPMNCALVISNKKKIYEKNGKAFLFDATYMHSAYNKSNKTRGILYIDFDLDGIIKA